METAIVFLKNDHGVTLNQECTGEGRFVRQTSGVDRYGHVILKIEPNFTSSSESKFSWEVSEDQIPFTYFDGVLMGVKRYCESDEFPGTHISCVKIRIIDGSYNEIDSSSLCFSIATMYAMRDALKAFNIGALKA